MHILAIVGAVVGGILFWLYRARAMGEAARELTDTVETVQGAWRRHKFRSKAERPLLDDVDDVRVAAVAMIMAVAESSGPISAGQEEAIVNLIETKFEIADGAELVAYARWLVKESPDPNNVSMRLMNVFNSSLGDREKDELLDMIRSMSARSGKLEPVQAEALTRLTDRLGR